MFPTHTDHYVPIIHSLYLSLYFMLAPTYSS